MSSASSDSPESLVISPSALHLAPGVTLTDLQRYHVAIVLDLFAAKGTLSKLDDNFSEDAVYEDLFASANNREEVGGQLLHLTTICKSARTHSHTVKSVKPTTTLVGHDRRVEADEIDVEIQHEFEFKLPLPKGGRTFGMNTTLCIFSSVAERKIVRLQDRPMDHIPGNALLSVLRKMNAVGVPKVVGLPDNE
ncbi:hypothetical protein JCM24511_07492 [Saitozyma sp. JCM 24511]|nr:hypothetical protein JCM24511_07492 [Saitozyma sp. JCM 24511]